MPRIIPRLRLPRAVRGKSRFAPRAVVRDRLSDLPDFGPNPGNLRARCYVPADLPAGAPLVVVLHGCTQDAAVYDHGSGWSALADRHGFALLYPEQQRANNPMLCFNWFQADDTARGRGEAASIANMVEAIQARHALDPAHTFVTGLSAGGAMTMVMLAAYPELFAAGAPIAGVAFGCADSVSDAFQCMAGRGSSDGAALAASVRRASRHGGPWPRLQVWQGSADTTVVPGNADSIVRQWAALHGLPVEPNRFDEVAGFPRRAWLDGTGEPILEQLSVTGMAHGVPLATGDGDEAIGAAGAHMLDVGLSSTAEISAFFGIARVVGKRAPAPRAAAPSLRGRAERSPVQRHRRLTALRR
ncbi:MAG TPA: PHB depolymerase family esterase [Allosphingosinicella sp.]|jgi:poly(hydroxyalkanoate) depolymerase family esterase